MTKQSKKIVKPVVQDTEDPIDGVKLIGCLFFGIVILAILLSVGYYLISLIR